jgi:hypothetical protein
MKAACFTKMFISTKLYSFALQKKVTLIKFSLCKFLYNKLVLKWKYEQTYFQAVMKAARLLFVWKITV